MWDWVPGDSWSRPPHWVAALAALTVAMSLPPTASANGALTSVGTLSPSGSGQGILLGLAASGETVVTADALQGNGGGEIDLFTEPAAGWSSASPAATLTDPVAIHRPFGPSISGGTVVANDAPAAGQSFDDVFVEPPGGWSGTMLPAARLVAPAGENLGDGQIFDGTIVAFGHSADGTVSFLYVFVEPPGGWSGTVGPAATLIDSGGLSLYGAPVISGDAVFAGAQSTRLPSGNVAIQTVDVFSEPAGGWTGTAGQSATLGGIAAPEAVSGDVVTAGDSLFREPAGGWYGRVKPSATLFAGPLGGGLGIDAFSGGVAATSTDSLGSEHQCPCSAKVWLFTKPTRGWSGTVAAPIAINTTTQSGDLAIALLGQYLFTTGGDAIQIEKLAGMFGSKVGPPSVSFPFVSGLSNGNPQFSFTIAAGASDPPLTSFMLSLPKGLAYTGRHDQLTRAVSIAGTSHYTIAIRNGALTRARPLGSSPVHPARSPSHRYPTSRATRSGWRAASSMAQRLWLTTSTLCPSRSRTNAP